MGAGDQFPGQVVDVGLGRRVGEGDDGGAAGVVEHRGGRVVIRISGRDDPAEPIVGVGLGGSGDRVPGTQLAEQPPALVIDVGDLGDVGGRDPRTGRGQGPVGGGRSEVATEVVGVVGALTAREVEPGEPGVDRRDARRGRRRQAREIVGSRHLDGRSEQVAGIVVLGDVALGRDLVVKVAARVVDGIGRLRAGGRPGYRTRGPGCAI